MEDKKYPNINGEESIGIACEPAVATAEIQEMPLPDDLDYAYIAGGMQQITPDIEEEIAEVERGEVVSMNEFKTMFASFI